MCVIQKKVKTIKHLQDIIVTGATGFIGRRLIKELIKNYPLENILCLYKKLDLNINMIKFDGV